MAVHLTRSFHLSRKADKPDLSKVDKDVIEYFASEIKRIKIQRNEYESRAISAERKVYSLTEENKQLSNYINRTKSKH